MLEPGQMLDRVASRLLARPAPMDGGMRPDWMPAIPFDGPPVPAAVLIALIERETGLSVLYTHRSTQLRNHSGQIAFPGGRLDAADRDAASGAIREAVEEVALDPSRTEVIGFMPDYFTGTNYMITPVVAHVRQLTPFVANPLEVDGIFEVPLEFLGRAENYQTHTVSRRGTKHQTWRIDHQDNVIWGITANLTRAFRDLALADDLE